MNHSVRFTSLAVSSPLLVASFGAQVFGVPSEAFKAVPAPAVKIVTGVGC